MMNQSIYIGYEPRELDAFVVARNSIRRANALISIRGIILEDLQTQGVYTRPTETRTNEHGASQLWDCISEHWMSTQFAITRFFTPMLAQRGWALFMDCDMLVRTNILRLFEQADPRYAVMCVKHVHEPPEDAIKMDHQHQTRYARKNWSSVMLFNCDHPANAPIMTPTGILNEVPGRDLHRFCWLEDELIGELAPEWNYLVGYTPRSLVPDPKIVHFTDGVPSMPGYDATEFADEWNRCLLSWVR